MSLTLELHMIASDQAEVVVNGRALSTFDVLALRKAMPRREIVDEKGQKRRRKVSREQVVAFGRRLWQALGGERLAKYVDELPLAPDVDGAIVLHTADVSLAGLPWEMLYHPEQEMFLIEEYLLWREVPTKHVPKPPPADVPWRLVAQGCDPLLMSIRDANGAIIGAKALPRLRVGQELEQLRRGLLAHEPPVPLRWQQIAPTRAALSDLAGKEPLWFHYTGHGDVLDGTPVLCFDDGTGRMDAQAVKILARRWRGRVYLACLNACHTADSGQPSANLALELVRGGVPVVLGTQDSVLDDAAALFSYTFYQHLAVGELPVAALYWARQRLSDHFRNQPYEWMLPVLYMAEGYTWPQQQVVIRQPLRPLLAPETHTLALQAPDQLFGRDIELVELASLFVLHGKKVVTIRGAGGMGKTALAHGLAQRLRFHFADGIYAITLLTGAEMALQAGRVRRQMADVLGLGAHPAFDDPTAVEAQEVALVQAVQARPRSLLIFDNYETVLAWIQTSEVSEGEASPWETSKVLPKDSAHQEADAIQRLVKRLAAANAQLLFTSRQTPVGLAGEYLYPETREGRELGGLDKENSLLLFRAHAGSRRHTQTFAAKVCAAVEYSPLFIELAAKRWRRTHQTEAEFIATFDDAMLYAQQDGVPSNRRSAIVNVGLSVDALSPTLRLRFLTLSIIANPLIYPIHGAVIWGLKDENSWFEEQAHEQLELLRERSLLRSVGYDKTRNRAQAYTLQPVIAQVMRRLITADELITPRNRYAQWAAGLVNHAYGEDGIDFSADVAQHTQTMLDDLPIALSYLPAEERGWPMWRASWVFRHFGQLEQTQKMLDLAEMIGDEQEDHALLSRIYYERAGKITISGDLDGAMALYQQSLDLYEALGDVRGKATTQHQMAGVLETRGDLDGAMALYQQSLDIKEALGDVRGKAATQHQMARVLETRGDLDGAMALYQQSLDIEEMLGNVKGKASTLVNMAIVENQYGNRQKALRYAREGLELFERLGAVREIAQVRDILAQMEGTSLAPAAPDIVPSGFLATTTRVLRRIVAWFFRYAPS